MILLGEVHTLWHWWRVLIKINSCKVVISFIVTVETIDNSITLDLPISLPANKIPEQREKLAVLVSRGKFKEATGSQLINRRNPVAKYYKLHEHQDLAQDHQNIDYNGAF